MLDSLLIANRGEIARRIIRTARRLGIRTVAVYSDADSGMAFVAEADDAVRIGPAPARESYLVPGRILAAARATGAQAIHPGYGFLSENAAFAQEVIDAGLVWIGAPPAAIRAMGLKDAAKALMSAAGVPVTPGYLGEDQSAERLRAEAGEIGYPVLIKAVAGGGGKGMRQVERAADFADALDSCRREAAASFGDDRVLLEKYVTNPRHIEVQVFGDARGGAVHLFERDCSLQRRHQKVIEEAPAPGMDAETRAAVCAAAVRAARAVDYVGAGTIEFIADASDGLRADRIWFMEMNTRLQVEHPVTEAITGVDLVEWQIRVASGEPLPLGQEDLAIRGWAMEARLYAENPASGFLPSTGRLERLRFPEGVRVDSGVREGDEVTQHYDPMIAKLVVHAPTRAAAAKALAEAAGAVQVWPVKTNAGFLARAAADPDFVTAEIDTGFIARHSERLVPKGEPSAEVFSAAAAGLEQAATGDPWTDLAGFRLNAPADPRLAVTLAGATHLAAPEAGGVVERITGEQVLFLRGEAWAFGAPRAGAGDESAAGGSGRVTAPMPGMILAVEVSVGMKVDKGRKLVVLEAMKMEQSLTAPISGVVRSLDVSVGDQVSEGAELLRVEPEEA